MCYCLRKESNTAIVQNNKAFKHRPNWTDLKVKTVEKFGDQSERGEEDLQGIDVCGMSLTQLNSGLQQRRKKTNYKCLVTLGCHHKFIKHLNIC